MHPKSFLYFAATRLAAALFLMIAFNTASEAALPVKLNQLGFYPDSPKFAVIPGDTAGEFRIVDADTEDVVYTGTTGSPIYWEHSGETVLLADFSEFTEPGHYYLLHPTVGVSHVFEIRNEIHRNLVKSAIRALYYNRASIELKTIHAGAWARPAGHPDTLIYVHASAATNQRPEGYTISSPKGWYDAGDYNKYIVNSGISTYMILAAYEHFPEFFSNLYLNIPESANQIPDILDEARWNLDWMLTMQDPNDGGVYHKLTNLLFDGIIMPHEALTERFVVMKSTGAALNFAAVMAVAARVYSPFDSEFARRALEAAEYAWGWAAEHPDVFYVQPPDVQTGQYGDRDVSDEFDWAAAELYITTGNDDYWHARPFDERNIGVPNWQEVRPLAWISLAHHRHELTEAADVGRIENRIIEQGDVLLNAYKTSAYGISMGLYGREDFVWGSNGVAANHSLMLLQAYRLSGDERYLDAAHANLDYLLGRNATGYSYVTGFGGFPAMYPHHRPSAADTRGIGPVPGFLVGGPFPGLLGDCDWYPSPLPALSYRDHWCSYSTNEIAINWNAPLIYVTGAIEFYRNGTGGKLSN